jgi:hypothetical protein
MVMDRSELDRKIFNEVKEFFCELTSERFPGNIMEVVDKATKIDDASIAIYRDMLSGGGVRSWLNVYRMGLLMLVRNYLDAYLLSFVGHQEKLLEVLVGWFEIPCENVLVFLTPFARQVCFAMSVEYEDVYEFMEKMFGQGDVLEDSVEKEALRKAREKWRTENG